MPKPGETVHEFYVNEMLGWLKANDCRVINLSSKSPDGIAISRDGRIFAIDTIAFSDDRYDVKRRAQRKIVEYMQLGFDNVFALTTDKYEERDSIYSAPNVDEDDKLIEKMHRESKYWIRKLWDKQAEMEAARTGLGTESKGVEG